MTLLKDTLGYHFILFQESKKTTDDSNHVFQKWRPASNSSQNIKIRSYLSRFLKNSKQNVWLNPIVSSAITAERASQPQQAKNLYFFLNPSIDMHSTMPVAMNHSALHRPKLSARNMQVARPSNRSLTDQENHALSRGTGVENATLESHDTHKINGKATENGIVESRFGPTCSYSSLQGSFAPSQVSSNINRPSKPRQQIDLSIVSTPAPIQCKDDFTSATSAESVCNTSMDSSATHRSASFIILHAFYQKHLSERNKAEFSQKLRNMLGK